MRRVLTVGAVTTALLLAASSTAAAVPPPICCETPCCAPTTPAPTPTPAPTLPPTLPAPPPSTVAPPPSPQAPGQETTAAARFGWGTPNRTEEFDGPLGPAWNLYNGPGHAGNGRRTPEAVGIQNGIMTITGDAQGNTEGMAWQPGQKYGRWEGRVRAPASDETYNALLLLWPDAEDFPVGGEIDFMEMTDHTRQTTNVFLHYGKNNDQVQGQVTIDATRWHNWAVEWAPTHVAVFVDGEEWWRTEDTSILPPRAMHLCVQLDWFPENGDSTVTPSTMEVDWVRQYPIDPVTTPGAAAEGGPGSGAATRGPSGPTGTVSASTSSVGPLTDGAPDPVR